MAQLTPQLAWTQLASEPQSQDPQLQPWSSCLQDRDLSSSHLLSPDLQQKKFRLNGGFEMNGGSKLYSHVCHAYWP